MTISDVAHNYGPNIAYTNWDSISTTMCVCDFGFTGPDCSYCTSFVLLFCLIYVYECLLPHFCVVLKGFVLREMILLQPVSH